jgi:hypothetical protein
MQLYARWLAAAADVPRLRLLCDRLLGPTAPSAAAATPKERATKGSGSASSSGQIEELAAAATPLRPHPPLPWWSAEAGPTCCGGLLSKRGLLASTVYTTYNCMYTLLPCLSSLSLFPLLDFTHSLWHPPFLFYFSNLCIFLRKSASILVAITSLCVFESGVSRDCVEP